MTAEKAEKGDKGKRWIGFQAPRLKGAGLVAGIAGLIPLFLMIKFMRPQLDGLLGTHWGHFANNFILVLYCVALWPLVIKAVSKTENKAEEKAEE